MRPWAPALLAGCAACASGDAAVRPAGPRVEELELEGNRALSDGRIASRIATQDSDRFLLFFGEDHFLDPAAVAQDERRIADLYEEEGYWNARVGSEIVELGPGRVAVRFRIEEGPRTVVRTLLVTGLDGLPAHELAYVLDDLPLREGERFREPDWEASKAQILSRLRLLGHAAAEVDGRVEVAPAEGEADALIAARPGRVYEFGEVDVEGNLLVRERRIREMANTVLEPGDRYSPERIEDAQRVVFGLGVFSVTTVTPGEPDPQSGTVPVTVGVSEADFMRVRFGAGAGIDQNYYQVRALADFVHLDLFGGLQKLQFTNELAYRFVSPTSVTTGEPGPAGSSALELTQPAVIGPRVDLAGRLEYERELTPAYASQSIAGRLGTPILLRRWLYFVPSYGVVHYFDVEVFDEDELTPGVRPSLVGDCPSGCTLSYLEQRLTADRRSDPFEPRSGWYASLGVQEGGGIVGGDFSWIRLLPELRGYVPLAESLVLAARVELGWLWPLSACRDSQGDPYLESIGCTPIVVRFFGGGANDFRGVGADQLSPLRSVTQEGELRYVPLGGNSTVLGSTELRWYFAESWASAFFLEGANVAAATGDAFELSALQLALGAGLRYRTPVGPARLDVGYRFLREPREVVDGGPPPEENALDYLAIFLSLGEAY